MKLTELSLTTRQAAELIGFHRHALRFAIRQGQLKATRPGKRDLRIAYAELQRFCREHRHAKVRELVLA
jgi:excisionase family DNA binding protein